VYGTSGVELGATQCTLVSLGDSIASPGQFENVGNGATLHICLLTFVTLPTPNLSFQLCDALREANLLCNSKTLALVSRKHVG